MEGGGRGSKSSFTTIEIVSRFKSSNTSNISSRKTRRRQTCYRLSDVIVSLIIIFPLVIAFWRGVWNLMERYSKLYHIDPWLSIVVGYAIPFFLYLLQEPLKTHVKPGKMNFIVFYIISRYLLLLHSFGSVNQWRGLWALLDYELGIGFQSALGSLVVGVILSAFLKTFCNVLAPPLYLAVDDAHAIHDCPLRFHTPTKFKFSYLLDCICSVFVAASLVVSCWRGLWELADLYIYPDDVVLSAVTSLSVGYMVVIFLFTFQPHIYKWLEKQRGLSRLSVADVVTFVGFVGCVFSWRGLWMIYDHYFEGSDWATTIIGALGSLILGCISTIIVRGVSVDGELAVDGTAEWPIPYFSLLRNSIYDVPFPEPWLFRYLCTSQKLNSGQWKKTPKVTDVHQHVVNFDGDVMKNLKTTNSNHSQDLYIPKVASDVDHHHIELMDLSNIRNIDSSSEEDLGSRLMMSNNSLDEERDELTDEEEELKL